MFDPMLLAADHDRDLNSWTPVEGFSCRNCGQSRVVSNPANVHEWGCLVCNGASFSLAMNFKPIGTPRPAPE